MTQGDIAEAVEVSQGAVSAVILRRRNVSKAMAEKVWSEIERVLGGAA